MVTPELIVFIKASLEQGDSVETIKKTLFANGWAEEDVQEGVWAVQNEHKNKPDMPAVPPSQAAETKVAVSAKMPNEEKRSSPKAMVWAGGIFILVLVIILAVMSLRK